MVSCGVVALVGLVGVRGVDPRPPAFTGRPVVGVLHAAGCVNAGFELLLLSNELAYPLHIGIGE